MKLATVQALEMPPGQKTSLGGMKRPGSSPADHHHDLFSDASTAHAMQL